MLTATLLLYVVLSAPREPEVVPQTYTAAEEPLLQALNRERLLQIRGLKKAIRRGYGGVRLQRRQALQSFRELALPSFKWDDPAADCGTIVGTITVQKVVDGNTAIMVDSDVVTVPQTAVSGQFLLVNFSTAGMIVGHPFVLPELVRGEGQRLCWMTNGTAVTLPAISPVTLRKDDLLAKLARYAADHQSIGKAKPPAARTAGPSKAADHAQALQALLSNGRKLAHAGLSAAAEKDLKKIIAAAPGTQTAADAQKELDALPSRAAVPH
jgi:hypothetical protein